MSYQPRVQWHEPLARRWVEGMDVLRYLYPQKGIRLLSHGGHRHLSVLSLSG